MNSLIEGFKGLGAGRLIALAAVAVAMMGLLIVLAFHSAPTERMALLYSDLDLREASQINDVLDAQKIAHQLGANGSEIMVTADRVSEARLLLAKNGLPTGGSIGYEIFDRGDNLTASQFQQGMNQQRALEGELSRTIRGIKGIRAARVHLVLPKREPFAREKQEAQASVQVSLVANTQLDNEGTKAVINLVSAAVPGLRPQNVTLTDTRGNLLARAGAMSGQSGITEGNDAVRHASEQRLSRAVEEMLERSLGPGKVRADATIDFNYDQVHEVKESYDPDGQVVRSTQTTNNNSKTTEQNGSVSVANNLPNADAGASGAGSQEARQDETTNYEITKTVRTVVRDQPQIAKISLAVMVDGVMQKGADGALVWQERPAAELENIGRLVRSAVGFDEKRGDKVEVVSLRFMEEAELPDGLAHGALPFGLQKDDLVKLMQTGLFGLLALAGLLVVVRPMVSRLTVNALPVGLIPNQNMAGMAFVEGPNGEMIPSPQGLLGGPDDEAAMAAAATMAELEDESMVNLANVEGQLRASALRRVTDLIDKSPEQSMAVLRGWLHQEAA